MQQRRLKQQQKELEERQKRQEEEAQHAEELRSRHKTQFDALKVALKADQQQRHLKEDASVANVPTDKSTTSSAHDGDGEETVSSLDARLRQMSIAPSLTTKPQQQVAPTERPRLKLAPRTLPLPQVKIADPLLVQRQELEQQQQQQQQDNLGCDDGNGSRVSRQSGGSYPNDSERMNTRNRFNRHSEWKDDDQHPDFHQRSHQQQPQQGRQVRVNETATVQGGNFKVEKILTRPKAESAVSLPSQELNKQPPLLSSLQQRAETIPLTTLQPVSEKAFINDEHNNQQPRQSNPVHGMYQLHVE